MSPRCWRLFFFALPCAHTCTWTPKVTHTCTTSTYTQAFVPGLCCTQPGGRQQICLASWLMPPAMLNHRQLTLGAHLWDPPSLCTFHATSPPHKQPSANSGWWSWESKLHHSLSSPAGFSMVWLAHQPALRKQGHIGSLSAAHPPILALTYGHTHTETHKVMDRLTAPAPNTHPAGHWPMDRGHVAGRNASRCWALTPDFVPVCLPANYQPGMTHKNREGVLFFTLLIAEIALLSAFLSFWPLLPFVLAFLISYGSS